MILEIFGTNGFKIEIGIALLVAGIAFLEASGAKFDPKACDLY
jgi:hypothetical protein